MLNAAARNWEEFIHIMICDLARKVCETCSDQTFHAKCGRTGFSDMQFMIAITRTW